MTAMPLGDLEQSYEALARGIDRAGPEHEALFLAKLVLLLANEVGQFERFKTCVEAALAELPATNPET
jgi:Protein of unknown function (DUF2783)